MPVVNVDALIDERVKALRNFHQSIGIDRAELDLSGGVDSAVMAGLLVLALGGDNITLVYSSINSGSETQKRAKTLATAIGTKLVIHDLTSTYESMVRNMLTNLEEAGYDRAEIESRIENDNTILGSIRSCLRAPLGRGYLRFTGNGIRHGTGNECEDRWLRFYQKGGDGEVDTNPISMLAKGEVFQLARGLGQRLNAEESYTDIIAAPPTPELWGNQVSHTDEDEIGAFLKLSDCGETFYSYIDLQTGEYVQIGLIERLARFADTADGSALFEDGLPEAELQQIIESATQSDSFQRIDSDLVGAFIRAARKAEKGSRHKYNPACPTLGTRTLLVDQGILSDTLVGG
jgi:NH3-dependent NAD+ synthetase